MNWRRQHGASQLVQSGYLSTVLDGTGQPWVTPRAGMRPLGSRRLLIALWRRRRAHPIPLSIGGYTFGRDLNVVLRTLGPLRGPRERSRSGSGCRAAPPQPKTRHEAGAGPAAATN